MIIVGKEELIFDVTYFFGRNKKNQYIELKEDFDSARKTEFLKKMVKDHPYQVLICTQEEQLVEISLKADGFLMNQDYYFFPALKTVFYVTAKKKGLKENEISDAWKIYTKVFYSPHGKYLPCHHPFYEAEITSDGNVCTCCSAIMPYFIGNIKHTDFLSVWHSVRAKLLRLTTINGTAIFCRQEKCEKLVLSKEHGQPKDVQVSDYPLTVNIAVDPTCNLSCPSCRSEILKNDQELAGEKMEWLSRLKRGFYANVRDLYVAGNGECMVSHVYIEFLREQVVSQYNGNLHLLTNGQIYNKDLMDVVTEKFCPEILVSVDAWEKETYERLRRGGKHVRLMENIRRYIKDRDKGYIKAVVVRFVVQRDNYKEIPAFIEGMRKMGTDRIEFTRLVNGGEFKVYHFDELSLLDETGTLKKEYEPFFRKNVWPVLAADIVMDTAYLPKETS